MKRDKITTKPSYYELLADQALVGLLVFDRKSNTCVYANHMAREILNLTPADDDFNVAELEAKDQRAHTYKTMNKALLEHEGLQQEVLMRRKGGAHFIAQVGVKHLRADDYDHCVLMVQDMTVQAKLHREIENKQQQLKSAYEELLEQNRQLKALDQAKTKFIALVTHELRTPASGIVATAEMLKLGIYDGEAQLKEFVAMIHSEGKILLELINDILDFAKIQSGKMDYYIEETELQPVIEATLEPLESVASASEVTIVRELGDKNLVCYFDSLRLHQVVNNLVSNGIKYNKANGMVTVTVVDSGDNVRLFVKDTGKGISLENQPKIFNEFETLGKISNHTKGTGLGLPIAKRMIEAMGGKLGFESLEGQGSTFWIDIPKTKVLGANNESYRKRDDSGSGDLAA